MRVLVYRLICTYKNAQQCSSDLTLSVVIVFKKILQVLYESAFVSVCVQVCVCVELVGKALSLTQIK